jgi:predicted Zn-dependent protease
VQYLADTDYACDGTAGFFEKLLAEGSEAKTPEFLSSHPSSENRVEIIRQEAEAIGCSTELADQSQWDAFQESLPSVNQPGEVEPVETTPSTSE